MEYRELSEHLTKFQWLSELLSDKDNYSLSYYPWTEHAKQSSVNPDEFPTMNRDFCMLRPQSRKTWHTPEKIIRSGFAIEIFHTDTVKMDPGVFLLRDSSSSSRRRYYWQDSHENAKYATWRYQGVTRTHVEKLLNQHYKISLSLEKQSSATDWVPTAMQYIVEVEPDIWETRLALFFGEDFVASQLCVPPDKSSRRRNSQEIPIKKLSGEKYLELFRSRWKSKRMGTYEEVDSNTSPTEPVETIKSDTLGQLQGRKQKLRDRQLQTMPISSTDQQPNSSVSPTVQTQCDRGRLKRRERRKNMNTGDKCKEVVESTPFMEGKVPSENKASSVIESVLDTSNGKWRYVKRTNTRNEELAMIFEFLDDETDGDIPLEDSICTSNSDEVKPRLRITVKDLSKPAKIDKTTYQVFSYCQQCYRQYFHHKKLSNDNIQSFLDSERISSNTCANHDVYIGELLDEVGLFHENVEQRNINKIEAAMLGLPPPSLAYFPAPKNFGYGNTGSHKVRDQYWPKFSMFLEGLKDIRYLPHSASYYGRNHWSLVVFHHKNRHGYLDPYNMSSNLAGPHWRADWIFDFYNPAMGICDCKRYQGVLHDINAHEHVVADEVNRLHPDYYDRYNSRKKKIRLDEVLLHPFHYANLPPEVLRTGKKSLHRYNQPPARFAGPYFNTGNTEDDEQKRLKEEEEKRERQKIEDAKHKAKDAERAFELGVCYLMGLGSAKNIHKGLKSIREAAEMGSSRARNIYMCLLNSYDLEDQETNDTAPKWFIDESRRQMDPTFLQFNFMEPNISKAIRSGRMLAHYQKGARGINYTNNVAPFYNLENPEILLQQYSNKAKAFGSLLHIASLFGFHSAVATLLDAGFDIDARRSFTNSSTPLLCALYRGHISIAKLLIERGANCQPALIWSTTEQLSFAAPSPLHYLVYIDETNEATKLARLIVKQGADINFKCLLENLPHENFLEAWNIEDSVTPLRWAVIHEKPQLVRTFLTLGARFAREVYFAPSTTEEKIPKKVEGALLFETPCTNLEILEMFFARTRVPGISKEFSQTPLGLLVCEYDGPQRRLRKGFETWEKIEEAISLLLELQPGYEDILLHSAVRYGHLDIARYLLVELQWSIEILFKGLTCLHTAVLYGHSEMVEFLLSIGADTSLRTKSRQLTCYHLLILMPRNQETNQKIFELLSESKIEIDAREAVHSLTALHLAVRNNNLQGVKWLLKMGASKSIPVCDKLDLLSEGIRGYFETFKDRPMIFTKNLTILGEAILQYIQDRFYKPKYICGLIDAFMGEKHDVALSEDLLIDSGPHITLLHLLATVPFPTPDKSVHYNDYDNNSDEDEEVSVKSSSTPVSLLQQVLQHTPKALVDIRDLHGDTALHYACAAREVHTIESLINHGADINVTNQFGLRPIDILCWAGIFAGCQSIRLKNDNGVIEYYNWEQDRMKNEEEKRANPSEHPQFELPKAFELFSALGCTVDARLQQLALAWNFAISEVWQERGLVLRKSSDFDAAEEDDSTEGESVSNTNSSFTYQQVEDPLYKLFLDGPVS